MKNYLYILILIAFFALSANAQITSNIFVQTTSSADFSTLTPSTPLIFNLADSSWYYWNGSAFVVYPSVQTVNTRSGAVTLTSADVALGNVDNTSDANKPVSTATQTALNLKEATANKDATGGYAGLTLFKINFKNAANTFTNFFTNASTAARTYTFQDRDGTIADNTDLALKSNLASPTFTGVPLSTTAAVDTNTTQIATTAYVVGNAYSKLASPTFTGVPAAPTAAVDTNTTQLATTAYVVGNGYPKAASPTLTGTITKTGVTSELFNRTITAGGTTGAQTINKPNGTVNFAAATGTAGIVVTNSGVSATSIIFVIPRTNDTTCAVKNVVAAAGSFTIRMTANCTAETSVGFMVTN